MEENSDSDTDSKSDSDLRSDSDTNIDIERKDKRLSKISSKFFNFIQI